MSTDLALATGTDSRIAGYRVVRTLGQGERATVYLGHAGSAAHPRRAALKVYREGVAFDDIDLELEALDRAQHAHTVRLIDLATLDDGKPCLVFEALQRGSLRGLLSLRNQFSAGEAVTLVAPVAAAVEAMHASGACHGAIDASAVLFRDSGAPVLAKFGRARLIDPGAAPIARAASAELCADAAALARLASVVLHCVAGEESARLRSWLMSAARGEGLESFPAALHSRIFELGDAEPVRWAEQSTALRGRAAPARVPTEAAELVHETIAPSESLTARGLLQRGVALAQRSPIAAFLRDRVPARRRALLVGGGAGVVTLVIALALVPAPGAGGGPQSVVPSPSGTQSASSPFAEQGSSDASAGAVAGDDPVVAFTVLVRTRAECLRQLSILCLDAVTEAGSAAFDDDASTIQATERGVPPLAEPDFGLDGLHLVERYGDAALVSWNVGDSETASALLTKGEAGWRVRDYLVG